MGWNLKVKARHNKKSYAIIIAVKGGGGCGIAQTVTMVQETRLSIA